MRFLLIAGLPESLLNFRGPLIAALQAKGLQVHVAAPDLPAGSDVRSRLEARGVIVHSVALRRAGINPLADLGTLFHLWHLMRTIRPDAMLAYTIKPVIYGLSIARAAGVRRRFALVTGLGFAFLGQSLARQALKRVVSVLYRWGLAGVDRVFFQNPDDRDLFVREGMVRREQTEVVNGSGVDVEHFAAAPLGQGPVTFLLITCLLADKGIREYVAAARLVKKQDSRIRFLLAGPADPNPAAIPLNEAQAWHAEGVIEYLGELADVRPAIRQCSVYVLPSYREGTPRTNLEAMAMGRAVITTDAPGCRETVIDGENGFLVPVKSVDALAAAMQRFIQDPTLAQRMGARSRQIAEDKYDVHKVNAVMLRAMGI